MLGHMDQARQRLGELVRHQRRHLRLTIDAAAAQGGVSPVTWGRVENGLTVRGLSYGAVERVLGWRPGSTDEVLKGGEPALAENVATDEPAIPERLARDERFMKILNEMDPEDRRAHLQIINELWRRGQQRAEEDVQGYVERAITGLTG